MCRERHEKVYAFFPVPINRNALRRSVKAQNDSHFDFIGDDAIALELEAGLDLPRYRRRYVL